MKLKNRNVYIIIISIIITGIYCCILLFGGTFYTLAIPLGLMFSYLLVWDIFNTDKKLLSILVVISIILSISYLFIIDLDIFNNFEGSILLTFAFWVTRFFILLATPIAIYKTHNIIILIIYLIELSIFIFWFF